MRSTEASAGIEDAGRAHTRDRVGGGAFHDRAGSLLRQLTPLIAIAFMALANLP